jgi:hypothetical protein
MQCAFAGQAVKQMALFCVLPGGGEILLAGRTKSIRKPDCRRPTGQPSPANTPSTLSQQVPSSWTKNSRGVEPLHPLGVLQLKLHAAHTRPTLSASHPNKGVYICSNLDRENSAPTPCNHTSSDS